MNSSADSAAIFTSATPGPYELEHSAVHRSRVRPTGLVDPEVEVRPVTTQVDDLLSEIRKRCVERACAGHNADQTYGRGPDGVLSEHGVKVRYLHSDIDTWSVLRSPRPSQWLFDVLVGINLLREGWICRKFHWSRFWMPTRKASCVPSAHSFRPSAAARHLTAGRFCMPTESPIPCARRSTRPNVGAQSRSL